MTDKDDTRVEFFRRALGHEIRSFRQLRKLSRPQLAELVGISPTTLGRIERDGPIDVGDTWRLAAALNMPFQDLVARAEQTADRLYNNDLDELARVLRRSSDATDPDVDPAAGSATSLLDRRRAMQQIEDQAARDEKPMPDPKDREAVEQWLDED